MDEARRARRRTERVFPVLCDGASSSAVPSSFPRLCFAIPASRARSSAPSFSLLSAGFLGFLASFCCLHSAPLALDSAPPRAPLPAFSETRVFLFAAASRPAADGSSRRRAASSSRRGAAAAQCEASAASFPAARGAKGECPAACAPPPTACEIRELAPAEADAGQPLISELPFGADDLFSSLFAGFQDDSRGRKRAAAGAAGRDRERRGVSGRQPRPRQSVGDGEAERGGESEEAAAGAQAADLQERFFDPYEVLGVSSDSSAECIRIAYRRKAKVCHPDRAQAAAWGKQAKTSFAGARSAGGGEEAAGASGETQKSGRATDAQQPNARNGSPRQPAPAPTASSDARAQRGDGNGGGGASRPTALSHAEKFMLVRSAFELLSDKEKRRHFDRHGRSPDDPRFVSRATLPSDAGRGRSRPLGRGRGVSGATGGRRSKPTEREWLSTFLDVAFSFLDDDEGPLAEEGLRKGSREGGDGRAHRRRSRGGSSSVAFEAPGRVHRKNSASFAVGDADSVESWWEAEEESGESWVDEDEDLFDELDLEDEEGEFELDYEEDFPFQDEDEGEEEDDDGDLFAAFSF
ncbi:DnaJ domain-containing protein [Besnoitia besnoiti]|uniref:DnaJ domain-containing protein n=1 Tax=Besnoitia besnoiti TaxID=94643 RepID=A0A2A9MCR3_BESBE|nr:DnaJ domain-containing protein [Besnoitia besnoiti]PFH33387.1 DnaJ domain-containing protein [Besnoitia besnoiti]